MIQTIDASAFIGLVHIHPVIDVRAPKEYAQGHIPGAYNVPLFSDAERALVGTTYKQQGKEAAVKVGFDIVTPHMKLLVERAEAISPKKTVLLHCWRGGMRSSSVAWLLNLFGFDVFLLQGGYKAFRAIVREQFSTPRLLHNIGGYTGSGKTEILALLSQASQVIDLEALAHHRGSVFGHLGQRAQPTQEQFENNLGMQLAMSDREKTLFLEDESRRIGNITIPDAFWQQMRTAPLIHIVVPLEMRLKYLALVYSKYPQEHLLASLKRLEKRVGGLVYAHMCEEIMHGNFENACRLALMYYDKNYDHGLKGRTITHVVSCNSPREAADIVRALPCT